MLRAAVLEVIRLNAPDEDAYLRVQVQIEGLGMMATTGPVGWIAAALPRERSQKFATGLAAGVSSWTRLPDNAMPPRVKASANYHAGRLATLQAKADGYDSALLLTRAARSARPPPPACSWCATACWSRPPAAATSWRASRARR